MKVLSKFFILIIVAFFSFTFSINLVDAKSVKKIVIGVGDKQYIVSKKEAKKYNIYTKNNGIVKITKSLKVKAKKVGTTKVILKNKKTGKKIKYKIIVTNKLYSLKISTTNEKKWVNGKYNIKISKTPSTNKEKIYLSTSNNKVAIIKKGKIKVKSSGKVNIIAKNKSGKKLDSFWITTYNSPNIEFTDTKPVIIENGNSKKLKIKRFDYPFENIKFSSNHSSVIKAKPSGEVVALRPGNAVITAKTLDKKVAKIKVISKSDSGLVSNRILKKYKAYKYDNVMIVAHPDDETLWGGAHIYNESYFIVCLTNGYRLDRANDYRKILKFTKSGGIILNYPDIQDGIKNDWTYVRSGMRKDINKILKYKNWKKIVTYNPEGVTGHMHHIMNYEDVYDIAVSNNQLDKLYYFERFFKKGEIPSTAKRISDRDLNIKHEEIKLYPSVEKYIYRSWYHMLPYENFILSSDWYLRYPENNINASALVEPLSLPTSQIEVIGKYKNKVIMYDSSVDIDLHENEFIDVYSIPYDLDAKIDISGLDAGYHELPLGVNEKYSLNNEVKIKISIIDE